MTQRSQQRWNTGKRWKAWQYAEEIGEFYAAKYLKFPSARKGSEHQERYLRRVVAYQAEKSFPISPNLRAAFRCGAWKWIESQPVEF